MKRIFIYVKPNLVFNEFVEKVEDILNIPLLEYETDRYDEYPTYEIKYNSLTLKILGVPPDLVNLKSMWDDLYTQKDEAYQVVFLFYVDPPFSTESGITIDCSSYEKFGLWFIDKLNENGIYLEDKLPPLFSEV